MRPQRRVHVGPRRVGAFGQVRRSVRSGSRRGSATPGWGARFRRCRDRSGGRRPAPAPTWAGRRPAPYRCSERASQPGPGAVRSAATGLTSERQSIAPPRAPRGPVLTPLSGAVAAARTVGRGPGGSDAASSGHEPRRERIGAGRGEVHAVPTDDAGLVDLWRPWRITLTTPGWRDATARATALNTSVREVSTNQMYGMLPTTTRARQPSGAAPRVRAVDRSRRPLRGARCVASVRRPSGRARPRVPRARTRRRAGCARDGAASSPCQSHSGGSSSGPTSPPPSSSVARSRADSLDARR